MTATGSDEELAVRAAVGDRSALERLLRRHYDLVHRVARRQTRSNDDADDIAQEVCVKVAENIGAFRGEAKFTTWLVQIVLRACFDHHRRRTRLRKLVDAVAGLVRSARTPAGESWIDTFGPALKPQLQATLALIAEGYTHAEAARMLGVAESTVSTRMLEIRRHLEAENSAVQAGHDV